MKKIGNGFYTAMGTPLNADGSVCESGLRKHIEQQITEGAAGIFIMGTMGMQPAIKNDVFPQVGKIASDSNKDRVSLLIGVMDNSVERIKDRIKSLDGCDITGVVVTAPFFFGCGGKDLVNFFKMIADESAFPVYLYDQPGITNIKITSEHIAELANHPNIFGIKTADIMLARFIKNEFPDFDILYSHSDYYGAAAAMGVGKFLEGMFCCTPKNAYKTVDAFQNGNTKEANEYLEKILTLRDFFIKAGVYPCLTACMNLLGIDGTFNPDFYLPVSDEDKEQLHKMLVDMGELK